MKGWRAFDEARGSEGVRATVAGKSGRRNQELEMGAP